MSGFRKRLTAFASALGLALALSSPLAWALKCDVDNDGDIDRNDLSLL